MTAIIIETTVDDEAAAKAMADALIEARVAACVQLSRVQSTFTWNGQSMRDDEWLLRIKTLATAFEPVSDLIKATHSYDTPELLATPITHISASYLAWIKTQVTV